MGIVQHLAAQAGAALTQRELLLATAETFTGGQLAQVAVSVRDSARWFDRGFVACSERALQEMLGIAQGLLEENGAVSAVVAKAMAKGALMRSAAHVSVAITGVDWVAQEDSTPPVGTVHLAWGTKGSEPQTFSTRFDGDPEMIRQRAVITCLQGILSRIR